MATPPPVVQLSVVPDAQKGIEYTIDAPRKLAEAIEAFKKNRVDAIEPNDSPWISFDCTRGQPPAGTRRSNKTVIRFACTDDDRKKVEASVGQPVPKEGLRMALSPAIEKAVSLTLKASQALGTFPRSTKTKTLFREIFVFEERRSRRSSQPGVNARVAEVIIADLGTDPTVFSNDARRAMAWTGLCRGNDQSGGKRQRPGNRMLSCAAVEAALTAIRNKRSYFASLYRRLCGRRGHKQAVVAVAHALLKTAFFMIQRKTRYQDLGADYFNRLRPRQVTTRLVRRLQQMGYSVELHPASSV